MSALLRLAKIAPLGKWRALREVIVKLDKQKQAFLESHGPFLYLVAAGTQAEFRGAGLGSMLLDFLCRRGDAEGRCLYVETTSDVARAWLKRQVRAARKAGLGWGPGGRLRMAAGNKQELALAAVLFG